MGKGVKDSKKALLNPPGKAVKTNDNGIKLTKSTI
jgi:hypothetical protein